MNGLHWGCLAVGATIGIVLARMNVLGVGGRR